MLFRATREGVGIVLGSKDGGFEVFWPDADGWIDVPEALVALARVHPRLEAGEVRPLGTD